MKRLLVAVAALSLLGACGQSSAPTQPRPSLPVGGLIEFPAAPAGARVSLLDTSGAVVWTRTVSAGATSLPFDRRDLNTLTAAEVPAGEVFAGAADLTLSRPGARLRVLRLVMWRDANGNGTFDPSEALNLDTHDRVVWASEAVRVEYRTPSGTDHPALGRTIAHRWEVQAGWQQLSHRVYLPLGSDTHRRSMNSSPEYRFVLREPTPERSL